jgi:hypothetical protein
MMPPARVMADYTSDLGGAMTAEASAIYEPMCAMGWIGCRPDDHRLAIQPGVPIPDGWRDTVISRQLPCGIAVEVDRRGFAIYDFDAWHPGVANPAGTARIRTLAEASETAKPALVSRLRVINGHLALLHGAAMSRHDESPAIMRVQVADLYYFDYPDESATGYWFRSFGDVLPSTVTRADRLRLGTIPAPTFYTSLEWLDTVIAGGALIEFDLLNQTQSAIATHDYALAVTAAWTVCELRIRSLATACGARSDDRVFQLCKALRDHGEISKELAERLDRLRRGRNKWLHSGDEPSEAVALEGLALATKLLRKLVPGLATRATGGLVIL